MEARAVARYVRQSARKLRLVVDLVRGRNVNEAYAILQHQPKQKAAGIVEKVLRSAVANAVRKAEQEGERLDVDELVVARAYVNEGPALKRWRPRAMGRAFPIRKRTSHVVVVVDRREGA
jgi:large subunit ribosomal protein L22